MNLKDFAKTETPKEQSIPNEKLDEIKQNHGDLVEEFMKRYGKMDERQMMSEMFKLIQQKKQEGTFDTEQIRRAATQLAPFLSEEQRAYMYNLLNYLD